MSFQFFGPSAAHLIAAVAEKTFRAFRSAAASHPEACFVAVSHSDKAATDKWIASVDGPGQVQVVVVAERNLYAQWGLGLSSSWHVLNPWSMWNVYQTGKQDGIWNKPTESGNRWQTSGSFGVDKSGTVQWSRKAGTADEAVEFEEGVQAVS